MFSLDRILLPIDFSGRCHGAAHYADALIRHFHSELTVLHVLPPPHYEFSAMEVGGPVLEELYRNRRQHAEEEVAGFIAGELQDYRVTSEILEGDPAREIVGFAHERKMDLIMMPTHGYGPFRRFILGSVTAKVLHDADCPVYRNERTFLLAPSRLPSTWDRRRKRRSAGPASWPVSCDRGCC